MPTIATHQALLADLDLEEQEVLVITDSSLCASDGRGVEDSTQIQSVLHQIIPIITIERRIELNKRWRAILLAFGWLDSKFIFRMSVLFMLAVEGHLGSRRTRTAGAGAVGPCRLGSIGCRAGAKVVRFARCDL